MGRFEQLVVGATFVALITMLAYGATVKRAPGFPELYILGEDHSANPASYPTYFRMGQARIVYIGLKNRLGHVDYFKIEVKLWNTTPGKPPFNTDPVYVCEFVVENNGTWERELLIKFVYVEFDEVKHVKQLEVNGLTIQVNASSRSKFRLIFELYVYDHSAKEFTLYKSSEFGEPVWVQFWFDLFPPR